MEETLLQATAIIGNHAIANTVTVAIDIIMVMKNNVVMKYYTLVAT